jgi:hypothetical protein
VTLVGDIVPQVRPDGTVSVRVTTPAKPFTTAIVMVEVADWPGLTAAGEETVIVKSMTLNVAVAVRTSEPLVPFTVRL